MMELMMSHVKNNFLTKRFSFVTTPPGKKSAQCMAALQEVRESSLPHPPSADIFHWNWALHYLYYYVEAGFKCPTKYRILFIFDFLGISKFIYLVTFSSQVLVMAQTLSNLLQCAILPLTFGGFQIAF